MAVWHWALVAAVAFVLLALRAEVREAVLANPLLSAAGTASFQPGLVQLGVMVFAMTGGLALLVHYLRPERRDERYSRPLPRKNATRQASSPDKAGH